MIFRWFRRPPILSIGEAKISDAPHLAAIHAASFERGWDMVEFERLLTDRNVVSHVARPGGRSPPAAFALSRLVIDEAEILTVAVAPAARGAGLSKRILRSHLERLASLGARSAVLEVADNNTAALRLYKAFGFRAVGHRPAYYARIKQVPAAAILMRRAL